MVTAGFLGILIAGGALGGLLLGMLGLGLGLILVPLLALSLPHFGVNPSISMHMAIATSLAVIAVSCVSSILKHHMDKNVWWPLVAKFAIGNVIGAIIGSSVAHYLSTKSLKIIFAIFCLLIATKLLIGSRKKIAVSTFSLAELKLPNTFIFNLVGMVFAFLSSILGIGGGTFAVPFLCAYKVPMRHAVAVATVCSFVVAVSALANCIILGFHLSTLPKYSLGYVYLPAFLIISVVAVVLAPFGVKLARIVPEKILKRIFAIVLIVAAINMVA